MAYDNTNSGALFKNDKREKETHPHYKGNLEVKCPCCEENSQFWVSSWLKEAGPNAKKPGETFMSLALTPKEEKKVGNKKISSGRPAEDFEDDDIPF